MKSLQRNQGNQGNVTKEVTFKLRYRRPCTLTVQTVKEKRDKVGDIPRWRLEGGSRKHAS
jgi:hypothetical protein